ncbi:MAG: cbb3-type cytochrome c oxidase subunit 3 [Desulfobulbaceae bacterium]|nr:cbb3-type cytochrome c oxidase subunit 3 [Desulfobulbaceae bacterium]
MDSSSILYLGVTVGLFAVFALIVIRTMSRKRKDTIEAPKYRMLDDE